MKKEIEISGKTREEAIEKAVIELGAPSASAIMYTVINEGRKGFLGFGAVDCTIKAVYQVPDAPAEDKPRRERRDRNDRRDRRDGDRRDGDRRDRAPKKTEPTEEIAPEVATPVLPPVENIDPATATESEQTAYRFICKLVEDMALENVTIAMHPGNNDDMVITVDGEAAGVLIGHHGDTLDALQYLANLAANRKEEGEKREYARITVDVESYRAKREDALRILARKKAHQVLKYKKSIMLEPMNPYERRIIHSEIQKMEGVSTNSIGVENNRRIVIYLEEEGMPTAGIKAKGSSEKSGSSSKSRNRRRRSGSKVVDPLSTEALTGEARKQGESIFGEEEHDPFDIDLSAATYSEDDDNTAAENE
ncbi:MAG: KH domain-containing protein [Clostridia bacterium]|nr:KH domain-containing protein [Clostridia bacterium]